jgi:tRNA-splicing ligase RtcB
MLHSGSRNIGKELAERHISTAKSLWRLSELPAPDLAYFIYGTPEFEAYWKDLKWAQGYAMKNREIMMTRLLKVFNKMFNHRQSFKPELAVNCHHNYVALEQHYGEEVFVTRKGAINAASGTYGIIPGSMGAKSFIVKGKRFGGKFQLLLPTGRTQAFTWRCEACVYKGRSGTPDKRCRMSQGCRRTG